MSADRWALVGEAVVSLARRPRRRRPPAPLRRVPLLPAVVVAARWQSSPVGRFDEVAVLEPAMAGARIGLVLVAHGVSVPHASGAYRAEWSLPADPATIRWSTEVAGCSVTWEEHDLRIDVGASRWGIPLVVPLPLVHGGRIPFRVPQRLRGLGRPARVNISAGDTASDLAWLQGSHRGLMFRAARLAMLPTRTSPAAALQTLRLQLPTGPEPAARAAPTGAPSTVARSGALSSVG